MVLRSELGPYPKKHRETCSKIETETIISSVLIFLFYDFPVHLRKWIDVKPGEQDNRSYPIAKKMITILRHEPLHREEDGAIEFRRLKSKHWSSRLWKSHMEKGGGCKKRFQYCTDHQGEEILSPSLQDNVLIPNGFFEYIYHVGNPINLHSITNSGLIAGGRNASKERQTAFFTVVNPMAGDLHEQTEFDMTKPRVAIYKQTWKVHQDAVYWVNISLAQRKGLTFYQTRSNAIILYDNLPPFCIEKVVSLKKTKCIKHHVQRQRSL